MNLAIEKIVAVVIFLIIMLALIFFTGIPEALGKNIGLQHELRQCCQAYVARGCPSFSNPRIDLGSIYCDEETSLGELVGELEMDYDSLRTYCNCP
jgi:hypothetical protein